ncbi:RNA polymerase sigma factor [Kribbella sp. CA-293567]|uniref:RNA polymerase sigma factor n=1 Tax=Kribbella sp. CA-293567 TaxID=3002436 RepID=UPI0022DE7FB8|nr:sigma-70 family RNA polymerase sigma factor [Kribbella sp. CA-293567]WBQ08395.1 sigma-70 family RNA polymerase sigma factor [Kribbella sp. CA-293567]
MALAEDEDRPSGGVTRGKVDEQVAEDNAMWVRGLTAGGAEYEETVARLYRVLVKIAYSDAKRKGSRLHLSGPELDDIAHQAAADATVTICRKVTTFRGDCRFTTWAYRFVTFDVSSKVNRHFWQRGAVSIDENDWALLASDLAEAPEARAESRDLIEAVKRVIRDDLTDRQQRTFDAVAVRGLPIREVAEDLGSNPNAVYKTMFDARRKLRQALIEAGYLDDHCA